MRAVRQEKSATAPVDYGMNFNLYSLTHVVLAESYAWVEVLAEE